MIAAIVLPAGSSEAQRERFRGGGVFARPCPHAIAARREQAARALGAGDRARAVRLLREVCDEAPGEPRHRVELGDVLRGGGIASQVEAEAIWAQLAGDAEAVTTTLRVEVMERLARVAALRDDRVAVESWIRTAAGLPVEANDRRQLEAELLALGHRGAAAPELYAYFFLPGPPDTAQLAAWAATLEPEL